jgi:hypothetical protein
MIILIKIDSFRLEIVEMSDKVFMLPKLVLDMVDYYRWRLAQNRVCQEYRDIYELDESDHFNTGAVHMINRHNHFLFNWRERDERMSNYMIPDDSNYYIYNIKKCGGLPQALHHYNTGNSEAHIPQRFFTSYYDRRIVDFY